MTMRPAPTRRSSGWRRASIDTGSLSIAQALQTVCGPLRSFSLSCVSCAGGAPTCRVPARRPGNFHLRPQMKVTKAKGLNGTPFSSFFALRTRGPAGHWAAPLRIEAPARSTGPRCALALRPAGPRGRGFARPAPPSAPRVRCAIRCPSGPLGRGFVKCRTSERCCVEGLCFGDFHLAQQMKVTRPPGRDPVGNAATRLPAKRAIAERAQQAACRLRFPRG